jgi:hypothetical protein
MDVSRGRGGWNDNAGILFVATQNLQPFHDDRIRRVEFFCAEIRIDSILQLTVAALVQRTEIEPHFRNVWVESNSPCVGIEGVLVLVDLEVKDANRDPERGVAAITVYCLLISFIGLVVLLLCHVRAAEEIPALSVRGICHGTT